MGLRRTDSELVRHSLAKSRAAVTQMVEDGRVKLDDRIVLKPTCQVDPTQVIAVEGLDDPEYVSRGAHRLAGALNVLGGKAPLIEGRRALSAGASTGDFTDVSLRRDVASVVAIDVRYGQLTWKLRSDPRVEVHDRANMRTLDPASVVPAPELMAGDVSFISLTLVLPVLAAAAAPHADFLLIIKPQFEISKERPNHGGVVRNPEHHAEAMETVVRCAIECDLGITAIAASPLPGPSGSVEYFMHMRRDYPDPVDPTQLTDYIRRAVEADPAGGSRWLVS